MTSKANNETVTKTNEEKRSRVLEGNSPDTVLMLPSLLQVPYYLV